jgi:hypothetical protein
VPYGFLSGSATHRGEFKEREVDGFTDPSFRISMNFVGAPALALPAAFFAENDDFNNGGKKRQDPIYSFQGHVVYTFGNGIWAALDGTYYTGGQSAVNGVEGRDAQSNSRLGATLALPVNTRNSIKLYASTGVSTRTGSDFDTYGLAWQYRWGGGL